MYDEERYNNEIETAREEGMEEGRKEANKSVARKLMEKGLSVQEVAELTSLPEDVIRTMSNLVQL